MTLDEFVAKPKELSMQDYEKQLKKQKALECKCKKLIEKRFDCQDALEVLKDEQGSERYNKWVQELDRVNLELSKLNI